MLCVLSGWGGGRRRRCRCRTRIHTGVAVRRGAWRHRITAGLHRQWTQPPQIGNPYFMHACLRPLHHHGTLSRARHPLPSSTLAHLQRVCDGRGLACLCQGLQQAVHLRKSLGVALIEMNARHGIQHVRPQLRCHLHLLCMGKAGEKTGLTTMKALVKAPGQGYTCVWTRVHKSSCSVTSTTYSLTNECVPQLYKHPQCARVCFSVLLTGLLRYYCLTTAAGRSA